MICPAMDAECDCSELNPCLSALPYPEPTPTPSITVGTQVRLTGVVVDHTDSAAEIQPVQMTVKKTIWVLKDALEVIRQPFKRGEVVWGCGHDKTEGWLVVADESEGHALAVLVDARPGHNVVSLDVRNYERRP